MRITLHYRYAPPIMWLLVIIILFFTSCVKNPFWDDPKMELPKIKGKLMLDDGSSPESAYIWLEEFDLGTYPDEKGQFKINIPPVSAQNSATGASGLFYLYFFLQNCVLDSIALDFANGKLSNSQLNINDDGSLKEPVILLKLINVETSIMDEFYPDLSVTIKLNTAFDKVRYLSHQVTVHKVTTFSGILINGGPENITLIMRDHFPLNSNYVERGTEVIWEVPLPVDSLNVMEAGDYEIVPFILVTQTNKPPADLLDNFPPFAEKFHADYLSLPFNRIPAELILPLE